jgi:hypothetical protein
MVDRKRVVSSERKQKTEQTQTSKDRHGTRATEVPNSAEVL